MIRDFLEEKRRYIILFAVFLVLIILLALKIRGCMRLIDKPKKGDGKAVLYSSKQVGEGSRLIVDGASASALSSPENYGVTEHFRISGNMADAYHRQDTATFGLDDSDTGADVNIKGELAQLWKTPVGASVGVTSGLNWKGEAVIVKWDDETRLASAILDDKKAKAGLTEVIFPALDGKIYFLDLADGTKTREPIAVGCPMSGSAEIINNGRPVLVVGLGDCTKTANTCYVVIDLFTNRKMLSFGERKNFAMSFPEEIYNFSCKPVVSSDGTTMITRGENGVFYSWVVRKASGEENEVSLAQELEYTYGVKTDNKDKDSGNDDESGADILTGTAGIAAWGSYIFTGDDAGNLVCIDINDWHMVWIKNLGSKITGTPVLEEDEASGTVYLYVGTSIDNKGKAGMAYMCKLNAANGDIIWQRNEEVKIPKYADGGVIVSPCLGKNGLSSYVYFTVAGDGGRNAGRLFCLNKTNGGAVYTVDTKYYTKSNPVALYSLTGASYLMLTDIKGNLFLLDAETGECKFTLRLKEELASTPAVYEGKLVVGTVGGIYCIDIK